MIICMGSERKAIIDLGSNSIRLVIYEIKQKDPKKVTKKDFYTLTSTKKTVGLSAYVEEGVFTARGIEKASNVLRVLLEKSAFLGCPDVNIFATAVLRNCKNSKQAVDEIESRIDAKIDLLSGKQEAHLDFIGASAEFDMKDATLIDIGGGSTEFVAVTNGVDIRDVSLDQGSVSSYSEFVKGVIPTEDERRGIRKAFQDRLDAIGHLKDYKNEMLYGIGGSIRAAAKLLSALRDSNKNLKKIDRDDVTSMLEKLDDDPSSFAHAASLAIPDRIHTIGCALEILDTAMTILKSETVTVCKFGVREGYLIEKVYGSKS